MALAALVPTVAMAQGQQGSGSPYSAYGLGDLMGNTQVSQALMGGVGVGLIDQYSVISANPASYVSIRVPVFETGLVSRAIDLRTDNASAEELAEQVIEYLERRGRLAAD